MARLPLNYGLWGMPWRRLPLLFWRRGLGKAGPMLVDLLMQRLCPMALARNVSLSSSPFRARNGAALLLSASLAASGSPKSLTLPLAERPAWLQTEGMVMAGDWEPLLFRVRRDGSPGYDPTPEQLAAYAREHTSDMIAQLKALGVNFVMMHAYKGFGLGAERRSMADAVQFSQMCHDAGLHVGVYNFSGAFGWELFFNENPEAKDWVLLDQAGKPVTYESAPYRYFWNRNHPEAKRFYQGLVRFTVRDVRADLLHFDNYNVGPGFDTCSIQRFRRYLKKTFTSKELRAAGISDPSHALPPSAGTKDSLLDFAWRDFSCQSLADSYYDLGRYARRQRKDILLECNPGGPGQRIQPPVDHGRLLTGGEAFWDEDVSPGYHDGILRTRIRTYKLGRSMNNLAFAYTTTPLEAAEAMAFNLDCLGCICWFEYGKLVARPGSDRPVSTNLAPYVGFYTAHRELFCQSKAVADVGVLRSFASEVYADPKWAQLTAKMEESLIDHRVPFQIIYDQQMKDLHRYRVLVLAGCIALSDSQIKRLRDYVRSGGHMCIIGPVATQDEWLRPRSKPVLQDMPPARLVRLSQSDDCAATVQGACGGRPSLFIDAPTGLCAELAEQSGRRLVHLVNYRADAAATNVAVTIRLPPGTRGQAVRLMSPEHTESMELVSEQRSDCISFQIPRVNVYEVAVVEFSIHL
jgi:hypothetical protein